MGCLFCTYFHINRQIRREPRQSVSHWVIRIWLTPALAWFSPNLSTHIFSLKLVYRPDFLTDFDARRLKRRRFLNFNENIDAPYILQHAFLPIQFMLIPSFGKFYLCRAPNFAYCLALHRVICKAVHLNGFLRKKNMQVPSVGIEFMASYALQSGASSPLHAT